MGSPRVTCASWNVCYPTNATVNKNSVLLCLLTSLLGKDEDIGDYLAVFESNFNKLPKELEVAISFASLSNGKWLSGTIAASKTMETERITWDAISSRPIEEHRIQDLSEVTDPVLKVV